MSAWTTNPKGERVLVVKVYGDIEGVDGYDVAVIEMTPPLAQRCLDLIARARAMQKEMADFASIVVWDYSAEFYAGDQEADLLAEDEYITVPLWERSDDCDSRTEMDRMVVDHHGDVKWIAWVKHSDPPIHLSTEEVPESLFKQVIADAAVPA